MSPAHRPVDPRPPLHPRPVILSASQLVWGIFLVPLWRAAWGTTGVGRGVGLVAVAVMSAAFAAIVVLPTAYWRGGLGHWKQRWALFAVAAVSAVAFMLAVRQPVVSGALVYVCVEAVLLLAVPWSLAWVGAVAVAYVAMGLTLPAAWQEDVWSNLLTAGLVSVAVFGSVQAIAFFNKWHAGQVRLGQATLEAERGRIARDVHDQVGAVLTTIVLKARLADQRFQAGDDQAARALLAEIEDLSRTGLAAARQVVDVGEDLSWPEQLGQATQRLEVAGIAWRLSGAAEEVPPQRRALFAAALREAVTNIVRHAGATQVVITVSADRLAVDDDGHGLDGPPEHGVGLTGLTQRPRDQGMTVRLEASPLGGATLVVEPGEGRDG
jgi:two-component system sensor histidine kinase DesK